MEDSDPRSSNEIKRLSNLEDRVRSFKIITSGDGTVEGGFGPLPISEDPFERLANIEIAVSKFQLSGTNVSIAGSINDGFIIS